MRISITMASSVIIIAITALVLSALLAPSVSSPVQSKSAPTPIIVRGHVYDWVGTPIAGAEVNVSMLVGAGPSVRSYILTTTNSTGAYSVTFGSEGYSWVDGDTIEVVAEYGGDVASNTGTAIGALVIIDVDMSVTIPEFSALGITASVGGILGMFTMVFFARRRKTT